jgi:hypothetical protein
LGWQLPPRIPPGTPAKEHENRTQTVQRWSLNGRDHRPLEISSWLERRRPCDLYHSGLELRVPEGRYVIEQTPAGPDGEERGVVGVGPIGARWLADRVPLFRYELRRWRDGAIPDVGEAVASPMKLTGDVPVARRLLDLVSEVPMLTWGGDELGAGEMWNSNSQIAWLLARSGLDADHIKLPPNGRAPGWHAGLVGASRLSLQPARFASPLT